MSAKPLKSPKSLQSLQSLRSSGSPTPARRTRRATALASLVLAGGLMLAACGDDGDGDDAKGGTASGTAPAATAPASPGGAPSAPAAQAFNDADVMFAQMMIPHHEQAVEMAREAPQKASSAEVKRLAAAIEAAQGPEIEKMKGWLATWGKPTEAPEGHSMPGMSGMSGMMSDEEMAEFSASSGAEFDRHFLEMMIAHHNGAIEMAEDELAKGVNPEARALAESVKTSQAAEVSQMRELLGGAPSSAPASTPAGGGGHH